MCARVRRLLTACLDVFAATLRDQLALNELLPQGGKELLQLIDSDGSTVRDAHSIGISPAVLQLLLAQDALGLGYQAALQVAPSRHRIH